MDEKRIWDINRTAERERMDRRRNERTVNVVGWIGRKVYFTLHEYCT